MTKDAVFRGELVSLLPRLRRFALALTGSRDAAEDLLQAAVERAMLHASSFEKGRRLDSWVYKIMQNIWLDMRRTDARRLRNSMDVLGDEIEDGRRVVEARDELRLATAAFEKLPPEQRTVLMLVVLDGYSYKETADLIGAPVGTVMSRLARARAAIAANVRGEPKLDSVRERRNGE